jgi:hypothetical protein
MSEIEPCPLPASALLHTLQRDGGYLDAYACRIEAQVTLAAYLQAFYTTPLFKLERAILALCLARPSTDAQAAALAAGTLDRFAAWRVEARTADQVLLRDLGGRTASWLMVEPVAARAEGGRVATRLLFGSAVMPQAGRAGEAPRLGPAFRGLLGAHRLYSRLLLAAARSRLRRGG